MINSIFPPIESILNIRPNNKLMDSNEIMDEKYRPSTSKENFFQRSYE